jgi:hypothetical protein
LVVSASFSTSRMATRCRHHWSDRYASDGHNRGLQGGMYNTTIRALELLGLWMIPKS